MRLMQRCPAEPEPLKGADILERSARRAILRGARTHKICPYYAAFSGSMRMSFAGSYCQPFDVPCLSAFATSAQNRWIMSPYKLHGRRSWNQHKTLDRRHKQHWQTMADGISGIQLPGRQTLKPIQSTRQAAILVPTCLLHISNNE